MVSKLNCTASMQNSECFDGTGQQVYKLLRALLSCRANYSYFGKTRRTYIHKLYFISNLRVAFDKLMSSRKQ